MLESNIKTQLAAYLEKLQFPIELIASIDESAAAQEMQSLLQEITELSDKITLRFADAALKPSFGIARVGEEARVRFAGIPMGHEFTSLVLGLLQVGGHPPKIEAALIEQIKALPGELRFETFISLTCQNCPEVVQSLNLMAVLNPKISHVMIDGALHQDEVNARQIMAVPSVYLNGEAFGQGRMGIEEIVAKLDTGLLERQAEAIANKDQFDLLVIGGGPAGAAAAVYAARKGIRTGVVAERFGGQVLDTMSIENFISVQETEGPKLVTALEQHVKQYDVDIMNLQRAESLSLDENGISQIRLASGATLKSKSVIIATGARWREMNVPGEKEYRGRGVAYCPHCDGPLFKGKRVAVVGGGNSGVEAAIDLAGIVEHVTLLEFGAELRADAVLQKKLYSLPNVVVIKQAQTTAVLGDGQKVSGLQYTDRQTGESHQVDLAGIFVQIGLLPNTDWLKGTLDLSKHGEIEVDNRGQTSLAGVFAAGDVTTVPFKQIVIAMGDGAKASLGAFDHLMRS
ncbi:alkyl hydroperoxide reductase subunit F [Iodobacter fluviatilis]|uniref:Alkyl hydroperoxide reductase subunit F n=1 Tax=Iodobacter fluviatilis TaxID=537 RepID=A0A377Q4T3_9NEIS|nr:alkyl hydroperoxide reductase subunit F [Iodobacter fluviatilis]TCU84117.1 alkyl hydroperoxide reductase subunit F [Iodobacter fluviatilis]STQ89730.1 Alkyl hydroperoxide reductase subunit F [Iodobacter fluviatilis]